MATSSRISSAGLGLDFLHCRSDCLVDPNDFLQDVDTPLSRREPSPNEPSSTESDRTPLHLIIDSPSKSQSVDSPLEMSSSDSQASLPHPGLSNEITTSQPTTTLARHGTLFSTNAAPGRNIAELESILGDSSARLKPGASVLPASGQLLEEAISLEQAKSRTRIEVDILLDSNTCVQGSYLQGKVKVKIRERARNEAPVMISGGKLRIIGFESISNERSGYPFYQCSSLLSTITADPGSLCDSCQDSEGFAQAVEGEHTLPFSMYLPMSASYGVPKGSIKVNAGVAVRYIAMVSIKVKNSASDGRSIAHFYRDCEIWPRLNPSVVLAPSRIPLRAKSSDGHMPGSPRIHLTASVHRLHWVAGQRCFVKVFVSNQSKKSIKTLTLALIRTTVIFKPDQRADTIDNDVPCNLILDSGTTTASQKQVAESILELGKRGIQGHASAKGWWAGVAPGEQLQFSHSILLPPDALSVIRSRLLEVDYCIKVTISVGGTLRTTDVHVSLPIQIINFLSIDPPPSYPLPETLSGEYPSDLDTLNGLSLGSRLHNVRHESAEISSPSGTNRPSLGSLTDALEGRLSDVVASEDAYDGISDESGDEDSCGLAGIHASSEEELEDLAIYDDDADEVVPHVLQVDPYFENAPRFADLYYTSVQENRPHSFGSDPNVAHQDSCTSQYESDLVGRFQDYSSLLSGAYQNSKPSAMTSSVKLSTSFKDRVHAKLVASTQCQQECQQEILPSYASFSNKHPLLSHTLDLDAQRYVPSAEFSKSVQDDRLSTQPPTSSATHRITPATFPTSESASSLPYTKSHLSLNGVGFRSRLLPNPPIVSNVASIDDATERTPSMAAPSNVVTNVVSPTSTLHHLSLLPSQHHLPADVVSPKIDTEIDCDRPADGSKSVLPTRPSLMTIRQKVGGSELQSARSVKERIRELHGP